MENIQNVFVGTPKAGGAIWSKAYDGVVPTDAIAPLGQEYEGHGYISEDGIANEVETETEDLKAYGGRVVKTVQTSRKETYKFTPIETNARTLKDQYGDDNVTVNAQGNLRAVHNAKLRPARTFVIETVLSENKVQRDVIPLGRITEVGEKKYASGSALASEITVTCEEDAQGNTAYTYVAEIEAGSPDVASEPLNVQGAGNGVTDDSE